MPPLRILVIAIKFWSVSSNENQKVLPVSRRQNCLIKGICGTFDITSNYVGPVVPKKLTKLNNYQIKS